MTTAEQLADLIDNRPDNAIIYGDKAAAELRRLAAENESAHIVGIRQEREIMALEAENERLTKELERAKSVPMKYKRMTFNAELQAENERLRADAERYLECLRWVKGHIIRYDPPGLPNHLALKIIAAMKEQP